MTPEEWGRLKPLFHEAISLPPEERALFVAKVRLEDENIGQKLADLCHDDSHPALDVPLIDFHDIIENNEAPDEKETATLSRWPEAPIVAGRFRIVRKIGEGGMGEVYEAEDLQLKEHVALKMIRPELASNPQIAERFKREILLGKRIANPHVCRIHDLGAGTSADGAEVLFLTMELLNGETLSSRLKRGRMSSSEALPFIENMADGLAAAHEAGVIHRDFKSCNVMLVQSGPRAGAVITDFGLARASREGSGGAVLTKPGSVGGTVAYMAPEQIRGENVTALADIYSFGVVMFEMATGRLPFRGPSTLAIVAKHLNDPPPSPRDFAPDLDPNWEAVILRCLKKAPEERFASAADLKAALLWAPGASPQGALAGSRVHRAKISSGLKGSLLAIVALILIALAAVFYSRGRHLSAAQQRVAILEFENVGGDASNRVFCAGLMEALSSQLTELEQFQGSLSVIPASDIRRDGVTSARDAQRDFGATVVVTGSVQRSTSGVQLTINVDARELKQIRSHSMSIPESDAVSMQQGVAAEVAALLNIQLRPEAQRRLAQGSTLAPGAYDFYLQGFGYLLSGSSAADQAVAEFQHALERDPNYALAHAGLGQAYWNEYQATKDRNWIDQAWRECTRAIELGPQLSEPHVTLAVLNSGTGHYDEAIREAREAIRIDARNDRAYSELARALNATGQTEEAERTIKQAISLRSGYWNNYVRLGIFYSEHGKYKSAEAPFKQVIELVPDNPAGYTNLAAVYHLEGRESEAEQLLKQSLKVRPTARAYSNLATVYFFERKYADAVPIFERVIASGSKDYMQWGNLGDAYRWTAGDENKAARTYERAIALAEDAINVNPRDATAWSSMALYSAKLGHKPEAIQAIQKALSYAQDDKTILFKAAVVYELAGERAQALRLMRKAILGGYSLNEIATEPELAKLREDPGYSAVVSNDKR
jgi:tetratricopeptide (TPR) repeat protein